MENEKLNQEALKKAESVIFKWSWKNGIAWSPEALMAAIQAYLAAVPQPNEADVVEVMAKEHYRQNFCKSLTEEPLEGTKALYREAAQQQLRALTDAGYNIVKRG